MPLSYIPYFVLCPLSPSSILSILHPLFQVRRRKRNDHSSNAEGNDEAAPADGEDVEDGDNEDDALEEDLLEEEEEDEEDVEDVIEVEDVFVSNFAFIVVLLRAYMLEFAKVSSVLNAMETGQCSAVYCTLHSAVLIIVHYSKQCCTICSIYYYSTIPPLPVRPFGLGQLLLRVLPAVPALCLALPRLAGQQEL